MITRQAGAAGLLAVLFALAGCAESNSTAEAGAAVRTTGTDSGVSQLPARGVDLTGNALSGFELGLRREIEAVRVAQQRSAAATTSAERGEAIQASFEHVTIPEGAIAAGMPVERYTAVREAVIEVFRTLDFQGAIDGPLSIDLSMVDAATKERIARDPFADLPPASAAALRAEMDRLVPVWIEYVNLTATAG